MGLHTQTPLGVLHAILHRLRRMRGAQRTVHRLQKEIGKLEVFKVAGQGIELRIYQLEFVAFGYREGVAALGADTDPVYASRDSQRAIGFYCNGKAVRMDGIDQCRIELQYGFATGKYNVTMSRSIAPRSCNGIGQRLGGRELGPAFAVSAYKVRVAKSTGGRGPIRLAPGPQIASGEAAKYSGSSCLRAFALQSLENFFRCVSHGVASLE